VEQLDGAQFAWPGAIDRLREPARGEAPHVTVLAALDPACAWGSVLPWPALRDPGARPTRRVGASAILVDGALAVWVEPKAKRLATAVGLPIATIELALAVGLPQLVVKGKRRELLVETIDDLAASASPLAPTLVRIGAWVDYRGLVLHAVRPSLSPPPTRDAGDDGDDGDDPDDDPDPT
ncbi:MAG: hypothetical protein NT062_21500, partial [Proteobacteria bacterium]|nr:hypothetical protein [Pseudomonadota bacterium]